MKNVMKKLMLLMLMLVLTISVCACGDNETTENTETTAEDGGDSVQTGGNVVERGPSDLNLLTGLDTLSEEAKGKRPVAVMVNNIEPAFPQYGVAQADIIFEILVEGNQTRFMALYGDYTQVPQICSVRSARKYFGALAKGFDAVYVNWGMADGIRPYINSLNLTHIDGANDTNGLFGRDADRKASGYSLEHTGYFDGTKLAGVLDSKEVDMNVKDEFNSTAFLFNSEQVAPEGEKCTEVKIEFGAATAGFTYDEETGTYFKTHNGKAQKDGKTGTQLEFTNVIALETTVMTDPNGTHKMLNWYNGDGYYISNGVAQKIKFAKTSESSRLVLYDLDGNELAINPGKTYISMNDYDKTTLK